MARAYMAGWPLTISWSPTKVVVSSCVLSFCHIKDIVLPDRPTATMETGVGPRLWNSLPVDLRQDDIVLTGCQKLHCLSTA